MSKKDQYAREKWQNSINYYYNKLTSTSNSSTVFNTHNINPAQIQGLMQSSEM